MACISCGPRGGALQEATGAPEGRPQPERHHASANFCHGKPRMLRRLSSAEGLHEQLVQLYSAKKPAAEVF